MRRPLKTRDRYESGANKSIWARAAEATAHSELWLAIGDASG
jgi:hypothetical protein